MKRTITGLATNRRMTLGDLRHFLASVENVPDEAILKGRVGFGRGLKSVTIEEDDIGFRRIRQGGGQRGGGAGARPILALSPIGRPDIALWLRRTQRYRERR